LAQQALLVVLNLATFGLSGLGIDVIRDQVTPGVSPPRWPLGIRPPDSWSPLQVVAVIAAGILLVAMLHATLRFRSAISAGRLVQKLVVSLRSAVYDKVQRLSLRFFDANRSGSIINRVAGDVQAVRMFV